MQFLTAIKYFGIIYIYALSGRHCRPYTSSIKKTILNWHGRLLIEESLRAFFIRRLNYGGCILFTTILYLPPAVNVPTMAPDYPLIQQNPDHPYLPNDRLSRAAGTSAIPIHWNSLSVPFQDSPGPISYPVVLVDAIDTAQKGHFFRPFTVFFFCRRQHYRR